MHPAKTRFSLTRRLTAAAMALAVAGFAALSAPVAQAQSPFAAALYVNDSPITNYEITQKMRFLEFIGASGDNPRERAIERLIEDRLMLQEGQRLGGRISSDQVASGMAEFAGRVQLSTDEMVERLAQQGVDRATFEDFIRAGVIWRELVRARYGAQVRITESQVDHALSPEGVQPTTEVLISEIFLPSDPQFAETVQRLIPLVQRISTETEFANAARQVSAAPSATSGGRVDRWIDVAGMPPEVGQVMATAPIGAVLGPLDMPGAYAFFQLRARRENRAVPPQSTELEFRRALLPGGRSDANQAHVAAIRAGVDTCPAFDGVVLRELPELPAEAVSTHTARLTDLSAAERTELERLNPGQISANMVEGNSLVVLMLCARRVASDIAPPRDQVRMSLVNRELEGMASVLLQRLRAEADIRYP